MQSVQVDSQLEVNGAYLLGIINSMNEEDVKPFRERHGLTEIDPNKWYPASQVVNFYHDIANAPNGMFNLVAVGINVTQQIEYPPHVKTLADALAVAQQMHHAAWRGGKPSELIVEMPSERHARLTFHNLPLPPDLVYGICFGLVKRFSPPDTHFYVTQDIKDRVYTYDLTW
jgi:hypothetical protein